VGTNAIQDEDRALVEIDGEGETVDIDALGAAFR
jgi:hypothetical protein